MLTEWKLYNFKSIKELPDFRLGPVTVLAGANSSGKTTLLQSILLVAQTLSSPVAARALVLNGEVVKLGNWSDVPHSDFLDKPVAFECSIDLLKEPSSYGAGAGLWDRQTPYPMQRTREQVTKVKLSASFRSPSGKGDATAGPIIKQVTVGVHRATSGGIAPDAAPMEFSITVRRRQKRRRAAELDELVKLLPSDVEREALDYTVTKTVPQFPSGLEDDLRRIEDRLVATTTVGAVFKHFLPARLVQRCDGTAREFNECIRKVLVPPLSRPLREKAAGDLASFMEETMFGGSKRVSQEFVDRVNFVLDELRIKDEFAGSTVSDFANFLVRFSPKARRYLPTTALPIIWSYYLRSFMPKQARKFALEVRPVPDLARTATDMLQDFFVNRISYLGPLRDDPRVIYDLPPSPDIPDVGIKGQHTAAVLDRNKNRRVKFIDPATREEKESSLQDAVVVWLQHMGMLRSVSTEEAGKLGYKLTVCIPELDRELDLTTVGVGVSQVLPILVMALLASPGTLLIFEQPEIHLHPKVQSLLGDFFLSMGQLGKQCLIETHSEYLVNRLRLRIAEAQGDAALKLVKIYFVEREGNVSRFREVKANEYGAILEWPAGFFDEGALQAESIIRLGTEKRSSRSGLGNNEGSN